MTPIPFGKLMSQILEENREGTVFGIEKPFIVNPDKAYEIFGRKLETPFGLAAGLHTQLTQNVVTSYVTGNRFFEFKTIQKLDGEDLPVPKPHIRVDDECYNCEWPAELYVPQTFDEYVKAWFACKVLVGEYGLGSSDGFQLSMPMRYDLDGIKTEKIGRLTEGMKNASETAVFKKCRQWLLGNLDRFEKVLREDVETISPNVRNCATLSTPHGCPPQEAERIARYLIEEKRVYTFIKRNPTLLGYEYARKIMDDVRYDYVVFGDFHFKDDLQYRDVVPMLQRLQALVDEKGLEFGVKITNTLPVGVGRSELPSEEMYVSGKSLYPLSMPVAKVLAEDFGEKLRISYSGGAGSFNVADIVDADIWPATMATTILKPGSYKRLEQIGQLFAAREATAFEDVDATKAVDLMEAVKSDKYHVKIIKPLPSRKVSKPVPLTDCFIAPYQEGCPIHQDTTRYLQLAGVGEFEQALEVTLNKSLPPFITGTIYAYNCMNRCTRNFYESSVDIRRTKLEAVGGGFQAAMVKLRAPETTSDKKAVVMGDGPAGLTAAYFLARGGAKMTLFKKEEEMGGIARNVIPDFRIGDSAIDNDAKLVVAMNVGVVNGRGIMDTEELKKNYDCVVLVVGVSERGILKLETGGTINILDFLAQFKVTDGKVELDRNVVAIGGDNAVMDTTRTAKRNADVGRVSLVYRRARRYMPADEEKLVVAMEDDTGLAELLAPMKLENDVLCCKRMVLGDIDTSERRNAVETDQVAEMPTDTVIAAIGEKIPDAFYEDCSIVLDNRRRPQVSQETLRASVKDICVAGDDPYGPTTIVEGIRDGKMVVEAIIRKALAEGLFKLSDAEAICERKDRLAEGNAHVIDSTRCLSCNSYCKNCVEVYPDGTNISLTVPGMKRHQIIHTDYMCNECSNCKSFRPWDSASHLDKFILFASKADIAGNRSQGFTVLGAAAGVCKVRLQGKVVDYTAGPANAGVSDGIRRVIQTVVNDYSYML